MMISDSLSFADIDDLAQSPGMTYPDSPPQDPKNPYRVSSYVKDVSGKGILGASVNLYQADGKTLVATKPTDTLGRVFFDVPSQTDYQLSCTSVGSSPPYQKASSLPVSVGIFSYLFTSEWNWSNSVNFTVYPPDQAPQAQADTSPISLSMVGYAAVAVAVVYGIYWVFKPGTN